MNPALTNPTIICITNHKGGVGKTTSTANIADALARQQQRVLVMDLDPQFNLTSMLVRSNMEPATTVAHILKGAERDAAELFTRAIITETTIPNVHLVPSNLDLEVVAVNLRTHSFTSPAIYLRRRIRSIADQYDFILIDTPPSLGFLTMNSLAAATHVIVPFEAGDSFGMRGVNHLLDQIDAIRDPSINPELTLLGAIINGHDGREGAHAVVDAQITKNFNVLGRVPRSAALQRGNVTRMTILQADRSSTAAREVVRITAQILERCGTSRRTPEEAAA